MQRAAPHGAGADANAMRQRLGNRGAQAMMAAPATTATPAPETAPVAEPRTPAPATPATPAPTPARTEAPAAPTSVAAAARNALTPAGGGPGAAAAGVGAALAESAGAAMGAARERVAGETAVEGVEDTAAAVPAAAAGIAAAITGGGAAPAAAGVAAAAGGGAGGEGAAPAAIEAAVEGEDQQAAAGEEGEVAVAGGGGGGGPVELLMPAPPEGLSEADQGRIGAVSGSAGRAAAAQEVLPSASAGVTEAREAVTEPEAETSARAEAELASELAVTPAPSPSIEQFCERMRQVIHSRQPPDEESLAQSRPREEAQAAGRELESTVEGDVDNVQGGYEELQEQPEGERQQEGAELETPAAAVDTPDIGAQRAVPDPVPEEDVSLDADVEANAQAMQQAGMENEPAQLAQSGPVAEARGAHNELGALAETGPEQVLAEQAAAQASAAADMAALQAQALEALRTSRANTAGALGTQQTGMVGSEEQMRTQISERARTIFTTAQNAVRAQLEPLVPTAMARWNAEIDVLSTRFEADLQQVRNWLDERYSGVGGAILEVFEDIVGKPAWVTRAYNDAEQRFGDGVCALLREISTQINGVIITCEEIIANANTEIDALFDNLPAELQEWAEGEKASYASQLDNLHQEVLDARDNLTQDLIANAGDVVQEARERIHQLRLEAGGLVGRIADAIARFAENPAKFILEALLELVGIPPPAFWALVDKIQQVVNDIADDPMNFANNLAAALGQGFQQFFDHFVDHVIGGFFDWLFSGLGSVGVNIPSDFSLKSIITFFLELMGITWPRIRELLARHIGEENVALIEKAYELIATLIEQGPEGIFEMIKEQLNPQNILDMVIDAAIDFMIEALITAVTPRVIAMFNPAGAIVQAIEVIFRILKWVFDNAARIFSLIETVVNGAADLIAGNIGGMATAVEGALARLIPPVIDFLAGFLGLGDLPDKIADTIRNFQEWVMEILERVIAWLAERGRALLSALGLGGEEEEEEPLDPTDHRAVVARVVEEFRQVSGDADDYDALRAQKENEQRDIEQRYSGLLEDGIGLTITLAEPGSDKEDDDIDFTVRIAPNDETGTGQVPVELELPAPPGPDPKEVTPFAINNDQAGYESEYKRQVRGQEAGINRMNLYDWMMNAERYLTHSGNEAFSSEERIVASDNDLVGRKKIKGSNPFTSGMSTDSSLRRTVNKTYKKLKNSGFTPEEFAAYREQRLNSITDPVARQRAGEVMDNLWAYAVEVQGEDSDSADVPTAALHNPDMVAGGDPLPDDMGWRSINSSIGSNWGSKDRGRVREIHSHVVQWIEQNGLTNAIADDDKKQEILSQYDVSVNLEPD